MLIGVYVTPNPREASVAKVREDYIEKTVDEARQSFIAASANPITERHYVSIAVFPE